LARATLSSMMRDLYAEFHPLPGGVAKRRRRLLQVAGAPPLEIFLSGMRGQEHESTQIVTPTPTPARCRLCWPQDSIVYLDRLAITPDHDPFFPFHMLIRPVRPSRTDTPIAALRSLRRRLVKPAQLDCRSYFTEADIAALGHLAMDAPDYVVTQSMDGSGASIPEHIHAHAFLKSQTDFPLLTRSCFSRLDGAPNVWTNRRLTYAVLVRGAPEVIAAAFASMRDSCAMPSNHYFRVDNAFRGLVGAYVPRAAALPPTGRIAAAGWLLGAFEVLGLFDATTEDLFCTLSAAEAAAAIASVTLHDEGVQRQVEESCARAVLATSPKVVARCQQAPG
jgi:hypothetical protein